MSLSVCNFINHSRSFKMNKEIKKEKGLLGWILLVHI
jgi:hypothetical protein